MLKKAFTLAEVLITLGIIGVVAAITIPNTVAKYQKTVTQIKLKKTVNTMSSSFKKILADEEAESLLNTSLFYNNGTRISKDTLSKYLKFKINTKQWQLYSWGVFNERDKYPVSSRWGGIWGASDASKFFIILPDTGVHVKVETYVTTLTPRQIERVKSLGGSMYSRCGALVFDINGEKGPNISAKDTFEFNFDCNGNIYPTAGLHEAAFMDASNSASFNQRYWRVAGLCGIPGKKLTSSVAGFGCSGRLGENDYLIDYY